MATGTALAPKIRDVRMLRCIFFHKLSDGFSLTLPPLLPPVAPATPPPPPSRFYLSIFLNFRLI